MNPLDILTTYICNKCRHYEVRSFAGQEGTCRSCGSAKSLNTTNTSLGVSEDQLNEIYNFMDVYCHPFTSGGQEIPVQEAKLTELITLVTNYSCVEDSCTEESGGFPLEWHEYREPGTQFIKASTDADDIAEKLQVVFDMTKEERAERGRNSRQWVLETFGGEVIGKQLEEIIDNMPEVDFDYDLTPLQLDPHYAVDKNYANHTEFLLDIYKNILKDEVDKNSSCFKHWIKQLEGGRDPKTIVDHFRQVAIKENQKSNIPELEDFLDKGDEGKRIGVVIPESEVDVLLVNSLLKNLKKQYKEYNIYIFTHPQYFSYIEDNPAVHKCLNYVPALENSLALEGIGENKGCFEMVFHPHTTTQKSTSYIHNGLNRHQFSLV